MACSLEFLLIAESGVLEQQAILLCESIRAFGGRYANAEITVLQPRPDRPVSAQGRFQFQALGARLVELSISSPCPDYGPSIKVFACAAYEKYSHGESLAFLDSDMVLLSEPDLELEGADVAVRPVDVKGMCTAGPGDSNDAYWRELCRVCGVDYERLPIVTTTVDRAPVKASYNGGLTVTKPKSGLFRKTAEFFTRSIEVRLVPRPDLNFAFLSGHGEVSAKAGQLWGSSQAALSVAITALRLDVRILPASQNFPLHSYPELRPHIENGAFPEISMAHYHHVFREQPHNNPILADHPGFPSASKGWLRERTARFA